MVNISSAIELLDLAINNPLFQHQNVATRTAHFLVRQFKPSGIFTESQIILAAEKEKLINLEKNKSISVKINK